MSTLWDGAASGQAVFADTDAQSRDGRVLCYILLLPHPVPCGGGIKGSEFLKEGQGWPKPFEMGENTYE